MNTRTKNPLIATAAAATAALALAAPADAQNWMIRGRVIGVLPVASSSPVSGVDVDDQYVPEVDFTYFFTRNIAAELIAGTARHGVTLNGASLGKVNHLPPTLTVQYHFTDLGAWKPYVGAGINYTLFYNVDLASPLSVDKNSFGGALQIGTDFAIDKNWSVNLDVKKVWIRTDLSAAGTTLGKIKVDPVLVGVGVGYKF